MAPDVIRMTSGLKARAAAVSLLGIVIIGGRKAEDLKCPDVAGTLDNALFGVKLIVGDALLA